MLTYSIFEDEAMLNKLGDTGSKLDAVCEKSSAMILKLCDIYTAMTPEGSIKNLNIMEEISKLQRTFSEEYKEPYIQLHLALSDLIWYKYLKYSHYMDKYYFSFSFYTIFLVIYINENIPHCYLLKNHEYLLLQHYHFS